MVPEVSWASPAQPPPRPLWKSRAPPVSAPGLSPRPPAALRVAHPSGLSPSLPLRRLQPPPAGTQRQGGCVSFSRGDVFRQHASVQPCQESAGVFLGLSVSSSVLVLRSRPGLITTCTSNFSFYFFINNKSKMKHKTQLSNFLSAEELFLQTRSDRKSQSVREPNEGGSGPSGVQCQVWWHPSSCQGRWPQGARTPGQGEAGPGPPHAAGPSARDAMATPGRQPRPLQSKPPTPGPAPCPPSSSQARTISHQPACQIRGHITSQSK